MITRVIVSAIVLVITNLIVGSISLSLGLLVAVTVSAVAVIGLILLAVLGFSVLLEKLGLVGPGWTDSRLERLKSWAMAKWRELPGWYESEKHRIIEMMVQRLKGKEAEAQNPGAAWKSIAMGLGFLLGVLVGQTDDAFKHGVVDRFGGLGERSVFRGSADGGLPSQPAGRSPPKDCGDSIKHCGNVSGSTFPRTHGTVDTICDAPPPRSA